MVAGFEPGQSFFLTFRERLDFLETGQTHEQFFTGRSLRFGGRHQSVVPHADVAHRHVVAVAQRPGDPVIPGQKVRQRKRYRRNAHHKYA